MSKTQVGRGVYKLSNGKFTAELGVKVLGEFESEEDSATKYNDHVSKIFNFPVYNKRGVIPDKAIDSEVLITSEIVSKEEFNGPLKRYLEQKELEEQQKKQENKEDNSLSSMLNEYFPESKENE